MRFDVILSLILKMLWCDVIVSATYGRFCARRSQDVILDVAWKMIRCDVFLSVVSKMCDMMSFWVRYGRFCGKNVVKCHSEIGFYGCCGWCDSSRREIRGIDIATPFPRYCAFSRTHADAMTTWLLTQGSIEFQKKLQVQNSRSVLPYLSLTTAKHQHTALLLRNPHSQPQQQSRNIRNCCDAFLTHDTYQLTRKEQILRCNFNGCPNLSLRDTLSEDRNMSMTRTRSAYWNVLCEGTKMGEYVVLRCDHSMHVWNSVVTVKTADALNHVKWFDLCISMACTQKLR